MESFLIFFIRAEEPVVRFGVDAHDVVAAELVLGNELGHGFVVSFVGNDGTFHVVEEGVAVHVFELIRAAALPESEHHREGAGRIGAAFEIKMVLHPAVVVAVGIDRLRIDVFDLHLIEGVAADRVSDADISAPESVDLRALFIRRAVESHIHGLHPDGELRGSARLHGDGGGSGVLLRRAFAVRIGVVQHQDVGVFILLLRAVRVMGTGIREGISLGIEGNVVDGDIIVVLVLVVEREIGELMVVVLVQPGVIKSQSVPRGEAFPIRLCLRFRSVRFARGGGEVFPCVVGGVDDSARRLGRGGAALRGRTGGLGPARRRRDNQIFAVVIVEKLETAVFDPRGVRFRRRDFGIVYAGIVAAAAGGKRRRGRHQHKRR